MNAAGRPIIKNGTDTRVVMINPLLGDNSNDLPMLGHPFLAATYLVVDQDAGMFRLAKSANLKEGVEKEGRKSELVPILPSSCDHSEPLLPTVLKDTDGMGDGVGGKATKSLQPAIIASIAIGVVLGLVVVAGLVWYCRRRRRDAETVKEQGHGDVSYVARDYKAEVDGSGYVRPVITELGVPRTVGEDKFEDIEMGEAVWVPPAPMELEGSSKVALVGSDHDVPHSHRGNIAEFQ